MQKVLVSSCLLGSVVRYDGALVRVESAVLDRWKRDVCVVPCCPEVEGGLPVPRSPIELRGGGGEAVHQGRARAVERSGADVTELFLASARAVVARCREEGIRVAVLKERSPSCGSSVIYDGSFAGKVIAGQGVLTAALREAGIRVFSEQQWEAADACLRGEQP